MEVFMKTKRNTLCLALFVVVFISNAFYVNAQERSRIAVVNLQITNTRAVSQSSLWRSIEDIRASGDNMLGAISTGIINSRRFSVIERSRIDQIIREQGFQRSQLTDAQVVRIGRLLGVNKIVTGEYGESSGDTLWNRLVVNIRLIDVETGEIESAASVSGNTNNDVVELAQRLIRQLIQ
jgi:curli biogenesis system outer membrane secretion channel CsgG